MYYPVYTEKGRNRKLEHVFDFQQQPISPEPVPGDTMEAPDGTVWRVVRRHYRQAGRPLLIIESIDRLVLA